MSVEKIIRELTEEIVGIQDIIDELTPHREKKVTELSDGIITYLWEFQDLISVDLPYLTVKEVDV